jgi:hypothetical protein
MQKLFTLILFFTCINVFAQDSFQLARPLVKYESVFFKDSAKLELKFAQPGAKIHFNIYNRIPTAAFPDPTEKYGFYKKPIVLRELFSTVTARVFAKGFIPSETIQYSFVKDGQQVKRIITTPPNPKYPGSGDSTLFDNKGGIENASSKTWMGFDSDTVWINVELPKKEKISGVLLNFLRNESSWIFLPKKIVALYYDDDKNRYDPFGVETIQSENESMPGCSMRLFSPKDKNVTAWKISFMIITVNKIPDWHPAKGQHAWCFIDEIKVY